jgi:dTDP-4-dehydrorhamnose reductase|tara:strand:+ start:5531 stop:6256 length:726 start_codon:yes stop_codon:yes gene_type:complete
VKRLLVTGGDGNFATQLVKFGSSYEILSPTKLELDIRYCESVDNYFQSHCDKFDYVIHAAAITRPMVIHEDNSPISIHTNIIGTANVVLMCEKYKKKIIYISTDYVYPGIRGDYRETDDLNPFTNYGWSKLGGESSVKMYDNHLILRMAMVENPFPHQKVLSDMKKSLMYIEDAVKITLQLLDEIGTINVGGKAQTVYEFVKDFNPNVESLTLSEISDVNMATDCSMDTTKMKRLLDDTTI